MAKVYESGSGKWIKVNPNQGDLIFTSDQHSATHFDDAELRAANQCFWEFSIYKKTLHAVPQGTNQHPQECPTVGAYLKALENCDE